MSRIIVRSPGGEHGELFKFLPYVCGVVSREHGREDRSLFTLLERISAAIERETREGTVLVERRVEDMSFSLYSNLSFRLSVTSFKGGVCSLSYCHHMFDGSRGVEFQIISGTDGLNQRFHGWLDLKAESSS